MSKDKFGSSFMKSYLKGDSHKNWINNFYLKENPFLISEETDNHFLLDKAFYQKEGLEISDLIGKAFHNTQGLLAIVGVDKNETKEFLAGIVSRIKKTIAESDLESELEHKILQTTWDKFRRDPRVKDFAFPLLDFNVMIIDDLNLNDNIERFTKLIEFLNNSNTLIIITMSSETYWFTSKIVPDSFFKVINLSTVSRQFLFELLLKRITQRLDKSYNILLEEIVELDALELIAQVTKRPGTAFKLLETIFQKVSEEGAEKVTLEHVNHFLKPESVLFAEQSIIPKGTTNVLNSLKLISRQNEGNTTAKEIVDFLTKMNLKVSQATVVRHLNTLIDADLCKEVNSNTISPKRISEIRKNQGSGKIVLYEPTNLALFIDNNSQKNGKDRPLPDFKELRDYFSIYSGITVPEEFIIDDEIINQHKIESDLIRIIIARQTAGNNKGFYRIKVIFPYEEKNGHFSTIMYNNYPKTKNYLIKVKNLEETRLNKQNPFDLSKYGLKTNFWKQKKIIIHLGSETINSISISSKGELIGENILIAIPKETYDLFMGFYGLLGSSYLRLLRVTRGSKLNRSKLLPVPNFSKSFKTEFKAIERSVKEIIKIEESIPSSKGLNSKITPPMNNLWNKINTIVFELYKVDQNTSLACHMLDNPIRKVKTVETGLRLATRGK